MINFSFGGSIILNNDNNPPINWTYDRVNLNVAELSYLYVFGYIDNSIIPKQNESFDTSVCGGNPGTEGCLVLEYPIDKNKVLNKFYFNSTATDDTSHHFGTFLTKNLTYKNPENNYNCEATIITFNGTNLEVNTNLKEFGAKINGNIYLYNNIENWIPNLEEKLGEHYYMKAYVVLDIVNKTNGAVLKYILPNEIEEELYRYENVDGDPDPRTPYRWYGNLVNLEEGTDEYNADNIGGIPYVLLKPGQTQLSFNLNKYPNYKECEEYELKVFVYPIDGKCDLETYKPESVNESITYVDFKIPPNLKENIYEVDEMASRKVIQVEDLFSLNKFGCNYCSNECYFQLNPYDVETIPLIDLSSITIQKSIKTYYNGVLIRNENVSPIKIALNIHNLKRFKHASDAMKFVNEISYFMKNYSVEKWFDYNLTSNKTKVKIKYDGPSSNLLLLYQIIPKEELSNFDDLEIISNGNGRFFVNEKDPVIGWEFNSTTGSDEIEYEIPGNATDAIVILTEDPILFNNGNLIINYRENGCNSDEAHLFDLSSLEDSNILSKNTGIYQVCVAYLNSSVSLSSLRSNNFLDLFSYNLNLEASTNLSELSDIMSISTNQPNLVWSIRIQKENPGDFSCLGSTEFINVSGEFGDCDYKPNNRIWLNLINDNIPPKTKVVFPYVSHKLRVEMSAEDNVGGVGVENISYKIDSGVWNTINGDSTTFYLTCPNDWGCVKKLYYYSCDKLGNCEDEQNKTINIVDKGSSCKSDCMARPSPDRYLKECRNLNGCKYYGTNASGVFDDGVYVANLCHFRIADSWVKYNETYEIRCPNGPLRPSAMTNKKIEVSSANNKCDSLIKKSFPVMLNGETITMNIYFCN